MLSYYILKYRFQNLQNHCRIFTPVLQIARFHGANLEHLQLRSQSLTKVRLIWRHSMAASIFQLRTSLCQTVLMKTVTTRLTNSFKGVRIQTVGK